MPRHRLPRGAEQHRPTAPATPHTTTSGLAACPPCVVAGCTPEQLAGWLHVYREAYSRAVEAVTPPAPEPAEALFAVWN